MKTKLQRNLPRFPLELREVVLCTPYGFRRSNASRWLYDNTSQPRYQLGKALKCLANAICNCMLRYRTDGNSFKPVRFGTIWCRSVSVQPKTSRFDDSCWSNFYKNDAGSSTDLLADDRAKMGNFHGCLCFYGRSFRYICSCPRRRSIHASRHLCSWLPSTSRNSYRRRDGNSTNHRPGQHSLRRRWQEKTSWNQFDRRKLEKRKRYNQRFVTAPPNIHNMLQIPGGGFACMNQ
jgi:hypothetical protein